MKKCPQCGNDYPLNSNTCNHCGYSSENITNSYSYGNNEKKKSNIGIIILIVVLCLFFGPIIFGVIAMIFLVFSFNSIENIQKPDISSCYYVCNEYDYVETDDTCQCSNGDVYDKEGNKINDNFYDSSKIHLAPLDIKEWQQDILLDEPVVTVLCESTDYLCESYIPVIYDSALKNGYKLYIFDVDQLSSEDRSYLINKDVLTNFNNYYPYTFVIKSTKLEKSRSGIMYDSSLKLFLESSGVIEESY